MKKKLYKSVLKAKLEKAYKQGFDKADSLNYEFAYLTGKRDGLEDAIVMIKKSEK